MAAGPADGLAACLPEPGFHIVVAWEPIIVLSVLSPEGPPHSRAKVVRAAYAAASWARARRALWTDAPPHSSQSPSAVSEVPIPVSEIDQANGPSTAETALEGVRPAGPPVSRWPWQALAAGLAAAVTAAGVYLWMTVPAPARNAVRAAKPAAEISSHQPLINQARK